MLRTLRALARQSSSEEAYDIESPHPERPSEAPRLRSSASYTESARTTPREMAGRRSLSRSSSYAGRSASRPSSAARSGTGSGSRSGSASRPSSAARSGASTARSTCSSSSCGYESDDSRGQHANFYAEALYCFEAENTVELPFAAGQRLRIFPDVPCEPGWWMAELHGNHL